MSKNLFDDLINGESREEAKKTLYNHYAVKQKLKDEVENSIIGLQELRDAVKKAQHVTRYSDRDAEQVRKDFDKIAVSIEEFVQIFKEAYQEVNAIEVAHKLSDNDDKTGYIKFSDSTASSGVMTLGNVQPSTFVTTADLRHDHGLTFDRPITIKASEEKKGWNKKRI